VPADRRRGQRLQQNVLGGAAGVMIGFWGIRALISTAPLVWINSVPIGMDLRVLAFTLGVSVLTGILFGLTASDPAVVGREHTACANGDSCGSGLEFPAFHCWSRKLVGPRISLKAVTKQSTGRFLGEMGRLKTHS
jgi:hypothetical protein